MIPDSPNSSSRSSRPEAKRLNVQTTKAVATFRYLDVWTFLPIPPEMSHGSSSHIDVVVGERDPQGSLASYRDRPWVGILFECCDVYARIYRNWRDTAYVGWCPQCSRQVRLRIGPGGTEARFFCSS